IVDTLVISSYPGSGELSGSQQDLLISEIRQVASGAIFKEPTPEILAAVDHLRSLEALAMWAMVALVAAFVALGAYFGFRAIEHRFRARHSVERSVTWFMMFSSLVAILTTAGIVGSLVYEALQFFAR